MGTEGARGGSFFLWEPQSQAFCFRLISVSILITCQRSQKGTETITPQPTNLKTKTKTKLHAALHTPDTLPNTKLILILLLCLMQHKSSKNHSKEVGREQRNCPHPLPKRHKPREELPLALPAPASAAACFWTSTDSSYCRLCTTESAQHTGTHTR